MCYQVLISIAYRYTLTSQGFVRKANREQYDDVYFTQSVRATTAALLEGAAERYPDPTDVVQGRSTERSGVIRGPVVVSARYAMDAESLKSCCEALGGAAERYCGWMREAGKVPWVTTRIVYDRDCQVRMALYKKTARVLGADLAAAHAGEMGMVGHNRLGLGRQD